MKKLFFLSICWLTILFLSCMSQSQTMPNMEDNVSNKELEFMLRPAKTTIRKDEYLKVEIYLKNNTKNEIILCKPASFGTNHFVEIKDDLEIQHNDNYKYTNPCLEQIIIDPYIEIKFNEVIYGKEYLTQSGTWSLQISETFKHKEQLHSSTSWKGTIKSNIIEIDVLGSSE